MSAAHAAVKPEEHCDVKQFRFNVTSTLSCTKLVRGCEKTRGRTRPVTGKLILANELAGFFKREGKVLHLLHNRPHPGFPKLRSTEEAADGRNFIVMDNLGCDLEDYVLASGRLSEPEARLLFRQMLSAVSHCHANQIVLRDVKLGKIFFTDETCTSIVFPDLDGAEVVTRQRPLLRSQDGRDLQCAISTMYVCPEVLSCQPYEGQAADMWSLGVVLYRMLTGAYPFQDTTAAKLVDKIRKASAMVSFTPAVSAGAQDLIRRLLDVNPKCRPSAEAVLSDSWLRSATPSMGMSALRRRSSSSSLSDVEEFTARLNPEDGAVDQVVPDMCTQDAAKRSLPCSPFVQRREHVGKKRRSITADELVVVVDEQKSAGPHTQKSAGPHKQLLMPAGTHPHAHCA